MVRTRSLESLQPRESLLQSQYWAALKRRFGWHPYAFAFEDQTDAHQPFHESLLVLVRRPVAGFTLAYVPHGPELAAAQQRPPESQLSGLQQAGTELVRELPERCAMLRFDLPWEYELGPATRRGELSDARGRAASWRAAARGAGLRLSGTEIQPRATVLIDLTADEDALLAGMKSKWRYNVRLAARRGVTVQRADAGRLEDWYALYRATARRDRIAIHSQAYYRAVFEEAARATDAPNLELLLAYHEQELLAGIVVAHYRGRATYLYGAGADHKRNLMPAYALQWEAMRRARRAGMHVYDMFGIPRSPDEPHRMHGLYRFKTGFGGCIVERPGCIDLPVERLRYGAFRAAEATRAIPQRIRAAGQAYRSN